MESEDLINETYFAEMGLGSSFRTILKVNNCRNNGCNLYPTTSEQDLNHEKIWLPKISVSLHIYDEICVWNFIQYLHKVHLYFIYFLSEFQFQVQKRWRKNIGKLRMFQF